MLTFHIKLNLIKCNYQKGPHRELFLKGNNGLKMAEMLKTIFPFQSLNK